MSVDALECVKTTEDGQQRSDKEWNLNMRANNGTWP